MAAAASTFGPPYVLLGLPPLIVLHRTRLVRQLEEDASTDGKTGLLTAAAWQEKAGRAVLRSEGGDQAASVLVLDLDHFKLVNDRFGHLVGDQVLAAVAASLRDEVRDEDLVGRFGGEEFVVLLQGADGDDPRSGARAVAERIRERIAALRVAVAGPQETAIVEGLTVSIGGATTSRDGTDLATLLEIADAAMYEAKRAGRNLVRMGLPVNIPPQLRRVRSGPERQAALRRASRSSRCGVGQRTECTHPNFSKSQMRRADMSIWPRFTPCRAQVGSAWCRLCHDSPKERTASHQTLAERSRVPNGLRPAMWQIELIDQVTWCSRPTRTSPPHRNAVSAPHHDQLSRPPSNAGTPRLTAVRSTNCRSTAATSRSASRSGANRRALVLSRSNSQPMWACQKPRARAAGPVPNSHGECGSPSLSENAWWRRWSATQLTMLPWKARLPVIASATFSGRAALNDLWVKWRWNPTVTPSPVPK